MTLNILVIDDEADIRDVLGDIFEDEGYSVLKAAHSEQALSTIAKETVNLIILDIWLENSDMDGIEILKTLKSKNSDYGDIPVLMISGHGNVEMAVDAMKVGAYDFIEKPFKIDHILLTVERALEQGQLKQENIQLKEDVGIQTPTSYETASLPFQSLIKDAQESAQGDVRILVTGEIGTGKSKFARFLHSQSAREKSPLHIFAASEITETDVVHIFESDDYKGTTLLIERIEKLSKSTQSALLKILSSQHMSQNAPRLLCTALNGINDTEFSSALYDRISVKTYTLPPLRERTEDIPNLIQEFSSQMCTDMNTSVTSFGADAILLLQENYWKGNIRQLKSTIDWIVLEHILGGDNARPISSRDVLSYSAKTESKDRQTIPANTPNEMNESSWFDLPLREAREQFEKQYLTVLIKRFRGNISQMAGHIDMERTALHRKLKTMDIRYDEVIKSNHTMMEQKTG